MPRLPSRLARCVWPALACLLPAASPAAEPVEAVVHMLVPGFTVRELPVRLSNQNNLRFAPDGSLTAMGYDGRIWRLTDSDGDGLEDRAQPWWDRSTLTVPLGMAWSTDGLYVSSSGKVSRLRDSDGDGRADEELVVTRDWPPKDVASGNVDATAVTLDNEGRVYFGLLVQDYANAYRIRRRRDLKPAEIDWLKANGRWTEPSGAASAEDEFSLYDPKSRRGTIQRFDPRTGTLETVGTGIRVPVGLAFNAAGDLFNTDQEGETWMPGGNPLDELNHIRTGRHYGFPPRHPRWLPQVEDQQPVVGFGPQHQSACGLVFNEPRGGLNQPQAARSPDAGSIPLPSAPPQGLFGPGAWAGEVLVAGESRGKIWSVHLDRTGDTYVGRARTIARLGMLVVDVAISPSGALYVCCHSGPPDWGTGPDGQGRIFRIDYTGRSAPQPTGAWAETAGEVRVRFDRPIRSVPPEQVGIEFGEYVSAGDRFETLKPPYAVVEQQDASPRGRLQVLGTRLEDEGRQLVISTMPHSLRVPHVVRLEAVKPASAPPDSHGEPVELEYDLSGASRLAALGLLHTDPGARERFPAWAPVAAASAGTESRPAQRPDGDWENGRALFTGKLQCAKCHHIHDVGGQAGPDLSNLVHRDVAGILRDIREPSAAIHPEYVSHVVETRQGETLTGFLRRSVGTDSITIADADGRERIVPRPDIASLSPTALSLMPSGLLDGLSTNQVRDLLTFLTWRVPVRTRDDAAKVVPPAPPAKSGDKPLRLVLVAAKQDHGPGQHDYPAWQEKWIRLLGQAARSTRVEKAWEWPSAAQFESADAIVFYYWNHDWNAARYAQLDAFQARGGGIVVLHSAVIADRDAEPLADRIGLSAHPGISYRHMPFELELDPKATELTRGLPQRIRFLDEPYWPLVGDPARVRVIGWARVDGERRPLVWTWNRGKGRVFGSILGHYFWTLDDPFYRLLVLRGIAWAAHADPEALVDVARMEAATE